MLRIGILARPDATLLVTLEGRIAGAWVEELRGVLAVYRGSQLALDLAAVSFVDAAGEALLRAQLAFGSSLERCSPYVAALLGHEVRP